MSDKGPRELNAWIAEHVLGHIFTESPDSVTSLPVNQWFIHRNDGLLISHPWKDSENKWQHEWSMFRPTTCPADAMEVLKKCLERVSPEIIHNRTDGYLIVAEDLEDGLRYSGMAQTLELAICLFAKELFA